ncbi:MAG: FAD-dependent oxidoreductase [Solirubrobacterales bacterium]
MVTASRTLPPAECDLIVVGGGIVGLAVAREAASRRPGGDIRVLEAEPEVGRHQTGHSSGVVHAGVYYEPGSLKARLCVEGARALYSYCEERGLPHRRSGKLIVATAGGELARLDGLERRGTANGVEGLRRVGAEEIGAIEPHVRGVAALHSPATGVVDFVAVARSLAADLAGAGGSVHTGVRALSARTGGRGVEVSHSLGTTSAREAVFCAGLWSDRLAVACGAPTDPRIVPFRGAYLRVAPGGGEPAPAAGLHDREAGGGPAESAVRGNVYPVPDPGLPFLGAHLTRTLAGEVLIGPSALLAPARDAYRLVTLRPRDLAETLTWPGTWRLARRHWRAGAREIRRALSRRSFLDEAARMVPVLRGVRVVAGPAGVRAQALGRDGSLVDDFVIHRTEHALHVRNAPSPAATSALALAKLIADRLEQ